MDAPVMFKLSYGLYVLTAKDTKDNGCIINTAMQITASPNRILIMQGKTNHTHDMILQTGVFNLSILSEHASFDLFRHFGFQSGKNIDKFAHFTDRARSKNGLYYITCGTNAYLSASVIDTRDCGSHTMFLAQVTDGQLLNDDASLTYDYYQKHLKPAPEKVQKNGYRCRVCGYVYEGDTLPADYICPVCKHGAADFEKI